MLKVSSKAWLIILITTVSNLFFLGKAARIFTVCAVFTYVKLSKCLSFSNIRYMHDTCFLI